MAVSKTSVAMAAGLLTLFVTHTVCAEDWPQAAGPNHDWTVQTQRSIPLTWSVEENRNIRWRTQLPETGQSGIAVWGDRLYFSTMKPMEAGADRKKGSDIVVYCADADSGRILWQKLLTGDPKAASSYAYGFSSSSSPTPITDGKHVWFWNASGKMGCWTAEGKQVWVRSWTPTLGRPFNKQYEPIKVGNVLINVEPRDPSDPLRREDAWNFLRAFDATTGKSLWTATGGLTHYNTPVVGRLPKGGLAILSGRGAHHDTPEGPPGLSLTRVDGPEAGEDLWTWQAEDDGKAQVTQTWDRLYAYWLDESRTDLVVLNTADGSEARRISWIKDVTVTSYDEQSDSFQRRENVDLSREEPPVTVFPAWHANISTYPHLYFQCFTFKGKRRGKMVNIGPHHSMARIDVEKRTVEYLQIPFPIPAVEGSVASPQGTRFPQMTVNSRGIDVADDVRSQRDGWWWCFNGNPIAVNQYLFFTFMSGRVQIIDRNADRFDESALVSLNDLGRFGETWSVNTPSFSRGRLYHRTMKELICIDYPEQAAGNRNGSR